MVILFIFLILVFVLLELYNYKKSNKLSHFTNKAYDYYFNGDMLVGNEGTLPTNIGIGTKPDSRYYLNVNGTMTINGKLTLGEAVLDYDIVNKINKLPLYSKDKYCLYEANNKDKKQCVTRDQLGMITGHRKVVFENRYGEKLSDLKLRHHGRHHGSEPGNNRGNNKWHEGIGYKDVRLNYRSEPYWNREWHHTLQNKASDTIDDTNQFQLLAQEPPNIEEPKGIGIQVGDATPEGITTPFQSNFLLYNPNNKRHIRFSGKLNDKSEIRAEQSTNLLDYVESEDIPEEEKKTLLALELAFSYEVNLSNNAVLEKRGTKYCIRVLDKTLSDKEEKPVWLFFNSISTGKVTGSEVGRLTRYPYGTSYFTIENFDVNKSGIQRRVRIKDSAGRYMKIKRRMTDGELAGWSILLAIIIIFLVACSAKGAAPCIQALISIFTTLANAVYAVGGVIAAKLGFAVGAAGAAGSGGGAAAAAAGAGGGAAAAAAVVAAPVGAAAVAGAAGGTAVGVGGTALGVGTGFSLSSLSLSAVLTNLGLIGQAILVNSAAFTTGLAQGLWGLGGAILTQTGTGLLAGFTTGLGSANAIASSVVLTGAAQGGFIAEFTRHDMAFEQHYVSKDCDLTLFYDPEYENPEISFDASRKEYKCRFE
jgi:hypothetical protein